MHTEVTVKLRSFRDSVVFILHTGLALRTFARLQLFWGGLTVQSSVIRSRLLYLFGGEVLSNVSNPSYDIISRVQSTVRDVIDELGSISRTS